MATTLHEVENKLNEGFGIQKELIPVAQEITNQIWKNATSQSISFVNGVEQPTEGKLYIQDVGFIGKMVVGYKLVKEYYDTEDSWIDDNLSPQSKIIGDKIYMIVVTRSDLNMFISCTYDKNKIMGLVNHEIKHVWDEFIRLKKGIKFDITNTKTYKVHDVNDNNVVQKLFYLTGETRELETFTQQAWQEMLSNYGNYKKTNLYDHYKWMIEQENILKTRSPESVEYLMDFLTGFYPSGWSREKSERDFRKRLNKGIQDYGRNIGRLRARYNEYKNGNINEETDIIETTVKQLLKQVEKETDTNPTEAQAQAGNYKKGRINIKGLDIVIENPKGSYRRGTDSSGRKWEVKMNNTYGYFAKTKAIDGDAVDVFLGNDLESDKVFCIDQYKDDKFDETKVMLGFNTEKEAKEAYLSNYEKGWKGLKYITELDIETFIEWLDNHKEKKQRKPIAHYKTLTEENYKIDDFVKESLVYWHVDNAAPGVEEYEIGMDVEDITEQSDETEIVNSMFDHHLINENVSKDTEIVSEIVAQMILDTNKLNGQIILKYDDIKDKIELPIVINNTIINFNITNYDSILELKKDVMSNVFDSSTDISKMICNFSDTSVNNIIINLNLGFLNRKPTSQYFYNQIYHEVDHVFNYFEILIQKNEDVAKKTISWKNRFSKNKYDENYFDDILKHIFYYTDYSEQMGYAAGYYGAKKHKDETLDKSQFYGIINNLEQYIEQIGGWKEKEIFDYIREKYNWNNLDDNKIKNVLIRYCKKSIKKIKEKLRQTHNETVNRNIVLSDYDFNLLQELMKTNNNIIPNNKRIQEYDLYKHYLNESKCRILSEMLNTFNSNNIIETTVNDILFENELLSEATAEEIHQKYYSNISEDDFYKIIKAGNINDSVNKVGPHARWLLNLYRNGNLKLEDLYKAKQYIQRFEELKCNINDLKNYKSLSDLYKNVVEPNVQKEVETSKKQQIQQTKQEGAETVYEDGKWLAKHLKTKESAIYYGKGTQWCTAATGSDNYFDEYNKKGPLYVIIDKQNNRKYQFHYETEQYMNETDSPIDFSETSDELLKILGKLQPTKRMIIHIDDSWIGDSKGLLNKNGEWEIKPGEIKNIEYVDNIGNGDIYIFIPKENDECCYVKNIDTNEYIIPHGKHEFIYVYRAINKFLNGVTNSSGSIYDLDGKLLYEDEKIGCVKEWYNQINNKFGETQPYLIVGDRYDNTHLIFDPYKNKKSDIYRRIKPVEIDYGEKYNGEFIVTDFSIADDGIGVYRNIHALIRGVDEVLIPFDYGFTEIKFVHDHYNLYKRNEFWGIYKDGEIIKNDEYLNKINNENINFDKIVLDTLNEDEVRFDRFDSIKDTAKTAKTLRQIDYDEDERMDPEDRIEAPQEHKIKLMIDIINNKIHRPVERYMVLLYMLGDKNVDLSFIEDISYRRKIDEAIEIINSRLRTSNSMYAIYTYIFSEVDQSNMTNSQYLDLRNRLKRLKKLTANQRNCLRNNVMETKNHKLIREIKFDGEELDEVTNTIIKTIESQINKYSELYTMNLLSEDSTLRMGVLKIKNLDFIGEINLQYNISKNNLMESVINNELSFVKENKLYNVSINLNCNSNNIYNEIYNIVNNLFENYNNFNNINTNSYQNDITYQQYQVILNEYRGIGGYNDRETIDEIYDIIQLEYSKKELPIGEKIVLKKNVNKFNKINWIGNLNLTVEVGEFSPIVQKSILTQFFNSSYYRDRNSRINGEGKLSNVSFGIQVAAINGVVLKDYFYKSFYHEINHAYEDWDRLKNGDKVEKLYHNSKRKNWNEIRNKMLNGNDVEKEFSYVLYKLFMQTEINALVAGMYGELRGMNAQNKDDYKSTETYRIYENLKQYTEILNNINEDVYKNQLIPIFKQFCVDNQKNNFSIDSDKLKNPQRFKKYFISRYKHKIEYLWEKLKRSIEVWQYENIKKMRNESINFYDFKPPFISENPFINFSGGSILESDIIDFDEKDINIDKIVNDILNENNIPILFKDGEKQKKDFDDHLAEVLSESMDTIYFDNIGMSLDDVKNIVINTYISQSDGMNIYPGYNTEDYEEYDDDTYFVSEEQFNNYCIQVGDYFDSMGDQVVIYRSLAVDKIEKIDYEMLGDCWSAEFENAKAFGSHLCSPFVILKGVVDSSNVDWKQCIELYVIFSGGGDIDDENEIRIIDDTQIKNVEIVFKTKDVSETIEKKISKLLSENNTLIENIVQDVLESILTEATADEIHQKYYSNISKEDFNNIVRSDTITSNLERNKLGMYAKWLLNLYKNNQLKLEDLYKAREYIPIFDKLCKSNKIENKDVNTYKSLVDMYEVIESYYEEKIISKSDEKREIKNIGADKEYEDKNWLLIHVKTKEAAIYYGKNTKWCTAATGSDNYFEDYNERGPLYILIDKINNRKYQFHNQSRQFVNEKDRQIDVYNLILENQTIPKKVVLLYATRDRDRGNLLIVESSRGTDTHGERMGLMYCNDVLKGVFEMDSDKLSHCKDTWGFFNGNEKKFLDGYNFLNREWVFFDAETFEIYPKFSGNMVVERIGENLWVTDDVYEHPNIIDNNYTILLDGRKNNTKTIFYTDGKPDMWGTMEHIHKEGVYVIKRNDKDLYYYNQETRELEVASKNAVNLKDEDDEIEDLDENIIENEVKKVISNLFEDNKKLKDRVFEVPEELYHELVNKYNKIEGNKNFTTKQNYKRLKNIIDRKGKISYKWMYTFVDWRDGYKGVLDGENQDVEAWLISADKFMKWVDDELKQATESINMSDNTSSNIAFTTTYYN